MHDVGGGACYINMWSCGCSLIYTPDRSHAHWRSGGGSACQGEDSFTCDMLATILSPLWMVEICMRLEMRPSVKTLER